MNYCIEKFKDSYIRVKFDDMLSSQNNNLINSDKHYLDVKNKYLEKTNINCELLCKLFAEYHRLSNNYCCDSNIGRYTYRCINSSDTESVNTNIKNILQEQSKLFTEFTHYISFLNNQPQITNFQILNIKRDQVANARTTKVSLRSGL